MPPAPEGTAMTGPFRRLAAAVLLAAAPAARADDWPQWMGPDRDGVWKETGVLAKFPPGGPAKLWARPVALGYAGHPLVYKNLVVCPVGGPGRLLVAFDKDTGA